MLAIKSGAHIPLFIMRSHESRPVAYGEHPGSNKYLGIKLADRETIGLAFTVFSFSNPWFCSITMHCAWWFLLHSNRANIVQSSKRRVPQKKKKNTSGGFKRPFAYSTRRYLEIEASRANVGNRYSHFRLKTQMFRPLAHPYPGYDSSSYVTSLRILCIIPDSDYPTKRPFGSNSILSP